MSEPEISITNLEHRVSFGGSKYDHWYVEEGHPCLADWESNIYDYFESRNYFLAIDTLIKFLCCNRDTSAGYLNFDDWYSRFKDRD
jgi:hypothetical protein